MPTVNKLMWSRSNTLMPPGTMLPAMENDTMWQHTLQGIAMVANWGSCFMRLDSEELQQVPQNWCNSLQQSRVHKT